jgi:two-component sensor histidine kinase/PAS domain-containing protein
MLVPRLKARLSRRPGSGDYLLALLLAGASVLGRAALERLAPGVAHFDLLLPAVVLAGLFCGTGPAIVAATAGGAAIAVLFLGRPLLAWPPFNATQIDILVFLPASATVLWATSALRRFAADAAATEARLSEVFRQIPGAAAILEAPHGRLLLRSTQSNAVLGQQERLIASATELAAYGGIRPDGSPLAPDEYPIVRALKTGEVISGEPLPYRHPSGRLVDLEVHAGPVRGADGAIVASVGMAFDVSERVRAERRLAESEAQHRAAAERLRAALDAGALGLWEFDLTTRRVRLDATLAKMLDLPPEPVELPPSVMPRFFDPADEPRARKVLADAIAAGGVYADEMRMVTARQQTRWFVARGAVLLDIGKVLGVISDITLRREREDALQEALNARDVTMREADHRIKNSLQLVVSLLYLQLGRVADADARVALSAAMARVNAIADAHLALQQSPDLRNVEISRMLEDLCGRMGSLNPAVTVQFKADAPSWLDATQAIPLGLIASELLTNALRHAYPPGAPGDVTLTVETDGGMLDMTIADGGVGLPATPARRGLGTTVIDTLARQIGAAVASRSEPGQGTTVIVRLKPQSEPEVAGCVAPNIDQAQPVDA